MVQILHYMASTADTKCSSSRNGNGRAGAIIIQGSVGHNMLLVKPPSQLQQK